MHRILSFSPFCANFTRLPVDIVKISPHPKFGQTDGKRFYNNFCISVKFGINLFIYHIAFSVKLRASENVKTEQRTKNKRPFNFKAICLVLHINDISKNLSEKKNNNFNNFSGPDNSSLITLTE